MIERRTLRAREGWHVLHLFYHLDHGNWHLQSDEEKYAARTRLSSLVQEARALPKSQLLTFSVVTPKADLGLMLLTEDLHVANHLEKRLTVALGPDVLSPVFSFYSLTERSEYTMTEEDFQETLVTERNLDPQSPEFAAALDEFRHRMEKYLQDRLYPNMPDWPVFCFYPMRKRRVPDQNWYALPFEERKRLMLGHGRVGRGYAGRVRQLITGATGLDDWEWGVSLFAHDVFDLKSIVYDMRFDNVSAEYADFGAFFVGLQLPLEEIYERLAL
ncbi:MAG: heme-dependent peroxidase [Verrucomicrobia bacterium]|nr:heme-dependent peroxidase [Verrucomicrobiota bacterium]